MTDAGSATYVYCLLAAASQPRTEGAPAGLADLQAPRLLDAGGGLWLVVADAPLRVYGADAVAERLGDIEWVSQRAVAHDEVVEHFLEAATVLPMKLFTIFSSDARAIADVGDRRPQIDDIVARVAGCLEWGVRVHFDDAAARRDIGERAAEAAGDAASGRAFLQRKKSARDAAAEMTQRAREEVEAVLRGLGATAVATRRHPAPAADRPSKLLLDAAFLVPSAGGGDLEAAVQQGAERLAPLHCSVVLSGPWPPYNFVDPGAVDDAATGAVDDAATGAGEPSP